jgi:membrane protein YdbS with pleckstrin-like domain
MKEKELLKDEKLKRVLSPHPLSFMKYQSLCLFLITWGVVFGWLVSFSEWSGAILDNPWYPLLVWGIVLLVAGVAASLITVRWSIFFLYASIFLGGTGLIIWQNWLNLSGVFIPFYMITVSILGFLLVEWYRRSHKYIISNQRILFKGGIFTKNERTLRYDKISDINAKQGIIGQIFGFGTIIPISQSGFGLGADKSFSAGGVQLGGKKVKAMGLFGGGKDVQTPMSRSYFELHGVYPYKEIKKIVEEMVQGSVITDYQQEQVTFQKEQVDIQKQMRDLLKLQNGNKDHSEKEEDGKNEDISEQMKKLKDR